MNSTQTKTAKFLTILSQSTTLAQIIQTHAQIIINTLTTSLHLTTKLTQKLCSHGSLHRARLLVSTTPNPDIFLFNVLIEGLFKNQMGWDSISVYGQLKKDGVLRPNGHSYGFLIGAAGLLSDDWRVGRMVHGNVVVDGFDGNLNVGASIVNMYVGFGEIGDAYKVFDEMSERDVVVWNTMVSGFVKSALFGDAMRVFWGMMGRGVGIDSSSLASVIPATAELGWLDSGMGIQCLALKSGLHDHIQVLTGLVSLYAKCGDLDGARSLFGRIGKPDLICYNAMISGFTCNDETDCAVRLFNELLGYGEKVNSSTLVGLIPVSSSYGYINLVSCIHGFCVKTGLKSASSVSTAVTTVYSRQNEIELARKLFDESPEKSLASWNAMISGYAQHGLNEMAISLFQEMQAYDVHPNHVTITSVLSACAQLGALTVGKWVHELISKYRLDPNIYVSTALIDMYAKCGNIVKARELFHEIPDKNVVSWNAMISGYGLHGLGHEAVKLFCDMFHLGITPSEVTFLCVLYACSHAGLVDEGNKIFECMVHDYNVEPFAEHYACMIDLFGRAGQLQKAVDFIKKMPVEPGPQVWASLLGACLIHKATDLARTASDRLRHLDPENTGHYVSISNIYSANRNYAAAASVRQVAKNRSKDPRMYPHRSRQHVPCLYVW